MRVIGDAIVEFCPNDVGKTKIEIAYFAANTSLLQSGLEQSDPQMRTAQSQERHDQKKYSFVGHGASTPAGGSRSRKGKAHLPVLPSQSRRRDNAAVVTF